MGWHQELTALRAEVGIPALAAVEMTSAGIVDIAYDGVRRVDGDDAVRADDRFHIGSNAKAMTALLGALAVERGLLTWETTAADVLGVGTPTLRQLLTHAAGLLPYGDDDEVAVVEISTGTPAERRAAFARRALTEEPLFEPGARHAYSNAGPTVAAAMVEAVTGVPWETALTTELFDPLGIDGRVGWPILHAAAAPLGHQLKDGRLLPHDPATDAYALPIWLRPAGDVSMSIGDYGTFLVDQLAGLRGGGRLGPEAMYRYLHTPDAADDGGSVTYALGWGIGASLGRPISQHTGSADTFYAVVVLDVERDRGLAAVANSYTDAHERAVNTLAKTFLVEA
jgi:D-alanyl-D-alanine carboxypeptidase